VNVKFKRTGERRYGVFVDRAKYPSVEMNPAPSYDEKLPHDFVHFVVEAELGLTRGVFGQLAAGGNVGTFRVVQEGAGGREVARVRRKQQQRGRRVSEEGSAEAGFSERAATICHEEWLKRFPSPERLAEVARLEPFVQKVRAGCSANELESLSEPVIERICRRLERLSERWSKVGIGESITLEW
jgi:hypothetical protein